MMKEDMEVLTDEQQDRLKVAIKANLPEGMSFIGIILNKETDKATCISDFGSKGTTLLLLRTAFGIVSEVGDDEEVASIH